MATLRSARCRSASTGSRRFRLTTGPRGCSFLGGDHPRTRMKRLAISVLVVELSALTFAAAIPGGSGPQARVPQVGRANSAQSAASAPASPQAANDVIKTFCVGCHNDKVHRGEMSLASFDVTRAGEHADIAEKMVRKLRTGLMPPREASRKPDAATRGALVTALEATLDAAAAANPNPGRRSFQRLNRAEYAAAIRALLGLDIDVSTYLPADTISASFDNIADV